MACKWKGVIFDCDGVLVDSVPLTNRVILKMLEPYGIVPAFKKIITEYRGTSLRAKLDKVEEMIGAKLPPNFEKQFRAETYKVFAKEMRPVTGIGKILEKLKIPFCVASGGPPEKIRLNLKTTNLLRYFEGNIFSSYDIQSWKPEPDIFIHAALKMGFNPKECVVVEDSVDGIQAALKGGFDAIGITSTPDSKMTKETGATIIHSMAELEVLIL